MNRPDTFPFDIYVHVHCKRMTTHTLHVIGTAHMGNDGIGAYEFWGAHCFDHGIDYVEDFETDEVYIVHEHHNDERASEHERIIRWPTAHESAASEAVCSYLDDSVAELNPVHYEPDYEPEET